MHHPSCPGSNRPSHTLYISYPCWNTYPAPHLSSDCWPRAMTLKQNFYRNTMSQMAFASTLFIRPQLTITHVPSCPCLAPTIPCRSFGWVPTRSAHMGKDVSLFCQFESYPLFSLSSSHPPPVPAPKPLPGSRVFRWPLCSPRK